MKRILSFFFSLAIVIGTFSPVSFVSRVSAADNTVTEVIIPSFINEDGEKVKITQDSGGFPNSVHLGKDYCVPTEDPTNFSADCGIKYTDPLDGSASQFLVEPMTYAETEGFLLYIKTPENSSAVHTSFYIVYNTGVGQNASKYQYTSSAWYTLKKGDTAWQKAPLNSYGIDLCDGFEGYVYMPFDAFRNNKSVPDWNETDKICGLMLHSGTNAKELIYSVPMFVKRNTLTSAGLPTADKVSVGDRTLEYFGVKTNAPEYYGEKINYGDFDITRVFTPEYIMDVSLGAINYNFSSFWDGDSKKASFIQSYLPTTPMPLVSTHKPTSAEASNHWLGSVGIDASTSGGGEAVMFYLKLPEDAKNKSLTVDFGFDSTYNTYTYSGTYKALLKGEGSWIDLPVNTYKANLPDGFEGYILVPYSQITGGVRPTAQNCVTSMNLRITDLDGVKPTIFSAPIIVEHIGETGAAFIDGAFKTARDMFTGKAMSYAEVMVDFAGANAGDMNADNKFGVRDLVALKNSAAGIAENRAKELLADINGDAKIDASDLNYIFKRLLNEYSIETDKTFLPLTSSGDETLLANPDRGFRTHLTLNVKEAVDSGNPIKYYRDYYNVFFGYAKAERINMALAYIYLTDYRNGEIPSEALGAIDLFFKYCEMEEFKVMLRFAYCDNLNDLSKCADEATILRHIEQLKPLVAEYSHCIHTVECGFVGAYGEWASVYQKPEVDYETVTRSIVSNFCEPNNLFFSLRLPSYKNLIPKTDKLYSMIATNNDAMFGEQTREDWHSGNFQLGTEEWQQVCEEGAYTPQGGEMLHYGTLSERGIYPIGLEIIKETAHHWFNSMSAWNNMYESPESVIANWKNEVVTPKILEENDVVYCPSWFLDDNGNTVTRYAYDFLRDHLGYKLEAQSLKVTGECKPESEINVDLSIKNYGMSAAFCMQSSFVVLDENYNVVSKVSAGNPSQWYSHNPDDYLDTTVLTHNISAQIKTPQGCGRYYIAFCLENTMGKKAKLSNRIEFANGYNILHSFEI